MTAITLDLPDELAARLERLRPLLPQLLQRILGMRPTSAPPAIADARPVPSVYGEMLDLLARSPSPQEIASFKVSAPTQARLDDLLDKNREGALLPEESAELDTFQQVNHLLSMLKVRARKSLARP